MNLSFGKHKGLAIEDVVRDDLQYCMWVLSRPSLIATKGDECGALLLAIADWVNALCAVADEQGITT